MARHERQLIAYLAGDLDPRVSTAFDEHLIDCEECWTAVLADRDARVATALLREAAPVDLADKARFAVQLAAADRSEDPGPAKADGPYGRRPRHRLVAWGSALGLTAATLTALAHPWTSRTQTDTPVAVVVQHAQSLPSPAPSVPPPAQEVTVGGTRLSLRYEDVGGVEVLIATADRSFTEPAGARMVAGDTMAWSAVQGDVSLYCPKNSVLYAAHVPADELMRLAAELPAT